MGKAKWIVLLLVVTAIWGSTFALVKETLLAFGTFALLSLRFLLAAGVLAAYVCLAKKPLRAREIRGGAAIGFFLFLGYAAQTFGLNYISATNSAFITGLLIIFVPIFSALLLRRMPEPKIWLAVAVAVFGLYLLTGAKPSLGIGELATLICAAGFALEIIWIDKHAKGCSLPGLLLAMAATVGLLSLLLMLPLEGIPASFPLPALLSIAFLALFATVFAQAGQVLAQGHIDPPRTSLILMAEPIFAAIFGFLLLGETLTAVGAAGAALMLAGMFIAEYDFGKGPGRIY